MNPSVSLILLTKDGMPEIRDCLQRLRKQRYEGTVDVVCIDSGSTDGTLQALRGHGVHVQSIPPHEFHHARTRNLASARASGEVLVFLSQDAVPADDCWLSRLVAPFEDPSVGGVYGRQIPPAAISPARKASMASTYPEAREERSADAQGRIPMRFVRFSNVNSAVRREVWTEHRFYEESLVAEDHWICYRILCAGMKVVYEPAAAVVHAHERSLWQEFQWAVDNGLSLKRMGILDDPRLGGMAAYAAASLGRELAVLFRGGYPMAAARCVASACARWLGVQFGRHERRLPRAVMERLSLNMRRTGGQPSRLRPPRNTV